MNGPIHFCTGYLAARAAGYREHRFETLYVAIAAYSPDFDSQLSRWSPLFAHGIWTHTLLGMAGMTLALTIITHMLLSIFRLKDRPGFLKLFLLALLGGSTHLGLDAFTYYESAHDAVHHMYFWPIWNFPWHINTMFPGVSYATRVAVEVAYSIAVASWLLLYQWAYRKQNPLAVLHPGTWFSPLPPAASTEK